MTSDVIVVGGGVIGLAVAHALAGKHLQVILIQDHREGEASPAAAGMLAPGTEFGEQPSVHAFVTAARDRYPSYLDTLRDQSGQDVPLDRQGIIHVAMDDHAADTLRREIRTAGAAEWLDPNEVATLEPQLARVVGGAFYPHDGAVDPRALLSALNMATDRDPQVTRIIDAVHTIVAPSSGEASSCITTSGIRYAAPHIVLAAGAWAPQIGGLPRTLPIEPLRGQILMLDRAATRHVIYGPNGYLVPRGAGRTLIGSTMERAGFVVETTPEALHQLTDMAQQLCPGLSGASQMSAWAGLRPATPDLLPILGADPGAPWLLYACGHSRNGILMAPLTADIIAALILNEPPPVDLTPFRVDRF